MEVTDIELAIFQMNKNKYTDVEIANATDLGINEVESILISNQSRSKVRELNARDEVYLV